MARCQMQRQRAGNGRLPYAAFSYDKSQLGHREIVCGDPGFTAKDAKDAKNSLEESEKSS